MRMLLLLPLLAACTTRSPAWNKALQIDGPHVVHQLAGDGSLVGDQLLWVDGGRGRIFALDPAGSPPRVRSAAGGHRATFVTATPMRDALLVLTAGHEPTRRSEPPEAPTLEVVTLGAEGPQVAVTYPLPATFDRLSVSADGKQAIAFSSGAPHDDGAFFRNPNEIAIVALGSPPQIDPMAGVPLNPTYRAIRSLGAAPKGVFFSPPMAIPPGAGNERTLAMIMAENYLTLLDASHPERIEITVPLLSADMSATALPVQVLFVPDTASAYVRVQGSYDVFALAFEARPPADAKQNDFVPRINQPSAGRVARDMLLYREGQRTLILTANDTRDVAIIDPATSQFTLIPVGAPIDAILPVPAADPKLAILFSRSSPQPFVHFLNLEDLTTNLERNLTRRTLATQAHDLFTVPGSIPGDGKVLVVHDDARTVISILDLGPHRTDTPILGRVPLESFDFTGSKYLVGAASNLERLGILDLVTLTPYDFRLDYAPKRVFAVGEQVVVEHADPAGLVTVLPDPLAPRDKAHVLWGFLLEGALDQTVEE